MKIEHDLELNGIEEIMNGMELPNMDELLKSMDQGLIEGVANDIKEINLQELADILDESTRIITTNHAGFITNTIDHPTIGIATTIQAYGNVALLVKHHLLAAKRT